MQQKGGPRLPRPTPKSAPDNYMRASMGKDRLSHLALLHIHYTTPVDLDIVVDCYARLHPRRLQLENLQ